MKLTCPSCGAKVGVVYMLVAHRISSKPREGNEDGEGERPSKIILGPGVVDEGRPFGCMLCGGKRLDDQEPVTVVWLKLEAVAFVAWPELSEHDRKARIARILAAWRADSADGDRARSWLRELTTEAVRRTKPPDEVWERHRDVYRRWLDVATERGLLRIDGEGNIIPERQDIDLARRQNADELADQPNARERRSLLRWMAGLYAMHRAAREAGMT